MSMYTLRFKDGPNIDKLLHRNPKRYTWARLQRNAIKFAGIPSAKSYIKHCEEKFDESYRLVKLAVDIPPVKTRKLHFKQLPKTHRLAIKEAGEGELMYDRNCEYNENFYVRVETYRTEDIRELVEEVWEWRCTLKTLTARWPNNWKDKKAWKRSVARDRVRVRIIMKQIPKDGVWPYVSYWAANMLELQHVEIIEDDCVDVVNHGDGWHRIIAAIELNLPTIDIVYPGEDA